MKTANPYLNAIIRFSLVQILIWLFCMVAGIFMDDSPWGLRLLVLGQMILSIATVFLTLKYLRKQLENKVSFFGALSVTIAIAVIITLVIGITLIILWPTNPRDLMSKMLNTFVFYGFVSLIITLNHFLFYGIYKRNKL